MNPLPSLPDRSHSDDIESIERILKALASAVSTPTIELARQLYTTRLHELYRVGAQVYNHPSHDFIEPEAPLPGAPEPPAS